MIRVYLDTCCFNRPFDDQKQVRVKLESEAINLVLEHVMRGEWGLIGSDAIDAEIAAIRDPERRHRVTELARVATEHAVIDAARIRRQQVLEGMGFGVYDSAIRRTSHAPKPRAPTCCSRPTTLWSGAHDACSTSLPCAWRTRSPGWRDSDDHNAGNHLAGRDPPGRD